MAAIVSTRINRLQALAPRTSTVTVGLGTVVDYSSVTNTPTLGALASKDTVTVADIVGGLSASNITGLGALALIDKVDAATQVTNLGSLAYANSIAAENIGAGTLAAGVIYAGTVNASQVNAGTLTGVSFNAGDGAFTVASSDGLVKAKNFIGYKGAFTNAGQTSSTALTVSTGGAGTALTATSSGTGEALVVTGKSTFSDLAYFYGNVTVQGTLTATVSYATSAGSATTATSATSCTDAACVRNSSNAVLYCNSYRAAMQADGNFVAYGVSTWSAGTNASDGRVKENIRPTTKNGLDTIKALSVVDFTWKQASSLYDGGKTQTGFIAQAVSDIVPCAVHSVALPDDLAEKLGINDMLFLHKEDLVPYLVKAVQELAARVATLEAQ